VAANAEVPLVCADAQPAVDLQLGAVCEELSAGVDLADAAPLLLACRRGQLSACLLFCGLCATCPATGMRDM
jgi:hypothetical protein